jgi:hypothetical protein
VNAEQIKYRKHELAYAHAGYSFVAFICSCFGALGPSALRYLTVLAMLELRQHEALHSLQGLDPLDDSERAQYRENFFRASSAQIAAVMTKVTIMRRNMRLTGAPSLPPVAPVSSQHLAYNNPGVSDLRDLLQAPRVAPSYPFTTCPTFFHFRPQHPQHPSLCFSD